MRAPMPSGMVGKWPGLLTHRKKEKQPHENESERALHFFTMPLTRRQGNGKTGVVERP